MERRYVIVVLAICALLIVGGGCEKEKQETVRLQYSAILGLKETQVSDPQNLKCNASDGRVELSWEQPDSQGVAGYVVYRWTEGGVPTVLTHLPAGTLSFTDTGVQNGTAYFYLVLSQHSSKQMSGVGAQGIAKPEPPPPPPPPVVEPEPAYYDDYSSPSDEGSSGDSPPSGGSPPSSPVGGDPGGSPGDDGGCEEPPPGGGG